MAGARTRRRGRPASTPHGVTGGRGRDRGGCFGVRFQEAAAASWSRAAWTRSSSAPARGARRCRPPSLAVRVAEHEGGRAVEAVGLVALLVVDDDLVRQVPDHEAIARAFTREPAPVRVVHARKGSTRSSVSGSHPGSPRRL